MSPETERTWSVGLRPPRPFRSHQSEDATAPSRGPPPWCLCWRGHRSPHDDAIRRPIVELEAIVVAFERCLSEATGSRHGHRRTRSRQESPGRRILRAHLRRGPWSSGRAASRTEKASRIGRFGTSSSRRPVSVPSRLAGCPRQDPDRRCRDGSQGYRSVTVSLRSSGLTDDPSRPRKCPGRSAGSSRRLQRTVHSSSWSTTSSGLNPSWSSCSNTSLISAAAPSYSSPLGGLSSWRARPEWLDPIQAIKRSVSMRSMKSDAATLLDQLAPELPPGPLRSRILAAAEGNPLFVEQFVAYLSDEPIVDQNDSLGARTPPISRSRQRSELSLRPGSIGCRTPNAMLLEHAAVVGRTFWAGALAGLPPRRRTGRAPSSTGPTRPQGADPRERSEFLGEEAFRFRHLLIRDAAYASCQNVSGSNSMRDSPIGSSAGPEPIPVNTVSSSRITWSRRTDITWSSGTTRLRSGSWRTGRPTSWSRRDGRKGRRRSTRRYLLLTRAADLAARGASGSSCYRAPRGHSGRLAGEQMRRIGTGPRSRRTGWRRTPMRDWTIVAGSIRVTTEAGHRRDRACGNQPPTPITNPSAMR